MSLEIGAIIVRKTDGKRFKVVGYDKSTKMYLIGDLEPDYEDE